MLVTRYNYLGEDLTATLRLQNPFRKENTPETKDLMAAALFNDPGAIVVHPNVQAILDHPDRLTFTYTVEEPLKQKHAETPEQNRLSDGKAASIEKDTLQTDGPMTIRADLGEAKEVGSLALIGFYRSGLCVLETVTVEAGDDGVHWRPVGFAQRKPGVLPRTDKPDPFLLVLEKPVRARYWKLRATHNGYSRTVFAAELVFFPRPETVDLMFQPEQPLPISPPRPLHVKRLLDKTLLDAGVSFLYGSYVTGTLQATEGRQAGVLISNRAGRQAVVAKQVIDLRLNSRKALESLRRSNEKQTATVEFNVIGGKPVDIDTTKYPVFRRAVHHRWDQHYSGPIAPENPGGTKIFSAYRYLLEIDRATAEAAFGGDLARYEELIATIRLATYDPDQQFTADTMTLLSCDMPTDAETFDLSIIPTARKTGRQAAAEALRLPKPDYSVLRASTYYAFDISAAESTNTVDDGLEIRELLDGIRSYEKPLGSVRLADASYPVAGEYDVLVVGGGTTGCPAAIAAARAGAKTLVLELQHELGGVGTVGSITGYYHGNRVGFSKETVGGQNRWQAAHKAHWWASELRKAGGEVWYGVLGAGAVIAQEKTGGRTRLSGVLVATEFGPRIVLAKVVIDTTGNGEIAMAAGAKTEFTSENEITVQGAGLSPKGLGNYRINNDYMYVDDADPIDATHVFIYGKVKYPGVFDQGKMFGTRERRRVVTDYMISPLDQLNGRTYEDSIAQAHSDFDSHGYTTSPFLELYHPIKREAYYSYYPYRASLPKGFEGLLVGGLATGAHRDALPMLRMQADLQNQGYALGRIAAEATISGKRIPLREVDIRKVQKHLVAIGNLPPEVLTEKDNYETLKAKLPDAVARMPLEPKNAMFVFWYPEEALTLLKKAYGKAVDADAKYVYAKALAALGDATGEKELIAMLQKHDTWDKGWNFKAYQQFGSASSPLDQCIMMLGRIKSRAALPLILAKLDQLNTDDDFSHHRACFLALEWIGDSSAVEALVKHLAKPGMRGHVHHDLEAAIRHDRSDANINLAEKSRRDSLKEIGAARALYRLGDKDGLGRGILEAYAKDLRAHFARHAAEILKGRSASP